MKSAVWALLALTVLALPAAGAPGRGPAAVDQARLLAADAEPGQWMSPGRNYQETHFSPLAGINQDNVSRLGLAWYADLDTYRGVEGTPLAIDGVLYNTTPWNLTTAYDARTGKVLWTYDPKVPPEFGPRPAATSSAAASPPGRARSSSPRSTGG